MEHALRLCQGWGKKHKLLPTTSAVSSALDRVCASSWRRPCEAEGSRLLSKFIEKRSGGPWPGQRREVEVEALDLWLTPMIYSTCDPPPLAPPPFSQRGLSYLHLHHSCRWRNWPEILSWTCFANALASASDKLAATHTHTRARARAHAYTNTTRLHMNTQKKGL